jgi:flagellar hook-associated protein 1 FlgK
MPVNIYQTAISGLMAAQQQLATTGHNIANVNTEGYSRQRAEQGTSLPDVSGSNSIGTGTYVSDISRVFSEFTYREQLVTHSESSYANKKSDQLSQLDATMSGNGEQISISLDNFYRSLNSLADQPNDLTLRSISISQANSFTGDLHSLQQNLEVMNKSVNTEITQITERVSSISVEISKLNTQIAESIGGGTSGKPNDLLDQRDRLVNELNEYTRVNTLVSSNGVMTVMIANGNTLVAGGLPLSMTIIAGDSDPRDSQIALSSRNSTKSLEGANIGGKLGALLEFREGALKEASSKIDLLALGVSNTLNQAQSSGLDLNANQGTNLFTDINDTTTQQLRAFNNSQNTGSVNNGMVSITDVSQLAINQYEIRWDGATYQATNLNTGTTTAMALTAPDTYSIADTGFEFNQNGGTPAVNDRFVLKPVQNSATNMQVEIKAPQLIAASSAIAVSVNDNNVSSGNVDISQVYDPEAARIFTNANKPLTVDVYENAPGSFTYRVYGNNDPTTLFATGAYLTGNNATIDIDDGAGNPLFQLDISGNLSGSGVNAREKFTIDDAFGVGNATNMLAMAHSQNTPVLGDGRLTFAQALANNISLVGSFAASSESQAFTSSALAEQAIGRHQSLSGVNLDEEAANMLQFQKAYQAAAKIISIADSLFDTILSSVR